MTLKTGLNPIRKVGGYNAGNLTAYSAGNSVAAAMYSGQLVQITSGVVVAGASGADNIGVVEGFQWIDSTTGQPVQSMYVPAGTSSGGELDGFTTVVAYVNDDPGQTYAIEADGALAATTIGTFFDLDNFGAGSTFTGRATAKLDASTTKASPATAGTYDRSLKLIGFYDLPDNNRAGSAPYVEVRIVKPDVIS
jgi:hypothetical protein